MKRKTLHHLIVIVLVAPILLCVVGWILFYPKMRRPQSSGRACCENLQKIDGAREQWALEHNKKDGDLVTWEDLVGGPDKYLKKTPSCPSGGVYTLPPVGQEPTCSLGKPTDRWVEKIPWYVYYDRSEYCFRITKRSERRSWHQLP